MAGTNTDGPSERERLEPGDSRTNPAGTSSEAPAEGSEDTPPPQPGSPESAS